jgi:hypothetical protein
VFVDCMWDWCRVVRAQVGVVARWGAGAGRGRHAGLWGGWRDGDIITEQTGDQECVCKVGLMRRRDDDKVEAADSTRYPGSAEISANTNGSQDGWHIASRLYGGYTNSVLCGTPVWRTDSFTHGLAP